MSLDAYVLVVDCCILTWLVATWFCEGHHKRCRVDVTCHNCRTTIDLECAEIAKTKKKIELRYDPLAIDECCYPVRSSNDGA